MQLKNGIRLQRRGAENAERRRGEIGEAHPRVNADWFAKLCVSPRSRRLCVKLGPGSSAWSRFRIRPRNSSSASIFAGISRTRTRTRTRRNFDCWTDCGFGVPSSEGFASRGQGSTPAAVSPLRHARRSGGSRGLGNGRSAGCGRCPRAAGRWRSGHGLELNRQRCCNKSRRSGRS